MNKQIEKEKKSIMKQALPHIVAVMSFLLLSMIYFSPALEDKTLAQSDIIQYFGASHEVDDYYKKEGQASTWTGSMFSGMPTYQITVLGGSPNFLNYIEAPLRWLDGQTIAPLFGAMLMAYILFCSMGFGVFVSALGAIAFGFSSYNIIIIEAGHVTKMWSLMYLPLILAGVVKLFQKKYFWGALIMALGLALQIKNNHIQITYYTGLLCVFLYAAYIVKEASVKNFKSLFIVGGLSLLVITLAISSNSTSIYDNYEMSHESTRGKSELTQPTTSEKQTSGLDKDYAFAWSYGKSETLSLLIPNIHGGASGGTVDKESNLYKEIRNNGGQVGVDGVQTATYWGDQPFTSGPVYFGAIICFLCVLGMIIIPSRMKWAILAATIFLILLSWGSNFPLINDWFFYHFPMYNKFRSVSMALVIPSITMVTLAVWAINEFFSGKHSRKKLETAIYWAGGSLALICIAFWIMPDAFFNFVSKNDAQVQSQVPEWYYKALLLDRKDLLSSDALRSLIFILLAGAALWVSLRIKEEKNAKIIVPALLTILVLIDLWNVDRRYLDDSNFKPRVSYLAQSFQKSAADNAILEDKAPSHRVLNLAGNPFNEANTSYYHKSIGGYSAAKLKRYQELIDYKMMNEVQSIASALGTQSVDTVMMALDNASVLNMLNAKYIIYNPQAIPIVNDRAFGNAWFVSEYKFVDTPDAEIAALNTINPKQTAVFNKKYESELAGLKIVPDTTATIELVTYKPDRLVYKAKANSEQLVVFSEIYYELGWEAYLDGKPVPHYSTDWVLRAMRLTAGEHEVEFKFIPKNHILATNVASVSSGILLLLFISMIALEIWNRNKKKKQEA